MSEVVSQQVSVQRSASGVRTGTGFGLSLILLSVAVLLAAWVGLYSYSPLPISALSSLHALLGNAPDQVTQLVIWESRLPRVLIAALVGAALASAGALMQALTRNSLASPGVFGVNAGAALGVALLSTYLPWFGVMGTGVAAVLGGGVCWLIVMLLGAPWRPGNNKARLVLAGVAVSALCAALTRACILLSEDQASAVLSWLAGSVASASWEKWQSLWIIVLPALGLSALLAPRLNILSLGDEQAASLGIRLHRLRLLISLLVLVLVGIAVMVAGSIAFVGLMVPHMARQIAGVDYRRVLPVSWLLGMLLVLLADALSRAVAYPTETPAGALLALIGAPCFIYLVRRRA
ncbi:iron chelate uptake ABC transporter family permease subunit [Pokkaliibacter sp. CJK22405]|uniref:iron chelate uptake ABC transporter family permease subunit n=1 Tax=Pokkaliibacter sp. CJK22405 TaxID=3384615 RepID=UPI00398467D9